MLELKNYSAGTHADDANDLLAMMRGLYEEDPASSGNQPSEADFERTVDFLIRHPERGRIVLIADDDLIQGYAILVPYWSNEFGGTILFVDELYVKPTKRSQGLGRRFLEFVQTQKPFEAVACALEVSAKNLRARKLYESAGFEPRGHTLMISRLR